MLKERPSLVEGEDFYREGTYIVFTARYHLRRGYCCESGCRHCPYRSATESHAEEFEKEAEDEA
jgi:2-iminoacetate synthase ThiH